MSNESVNLTARLERRTPITFLARNWALIFVLGLLVIFSFTGRGFFELDNIENILYLGTIYIFLAAGETFVIITGGIDLSVGFVMGLSSVLGAQIMSSMWAAKMPAAETMLVGSLAGVLVSLIPGFISGILIARYNVPPFIATLGMLGITNGVTLSICQGFPISGLPGNLVQLGNGYLAYSFPGKGFRLFAWPQGVTPDQARDLLRYVPNALVMWVLAILILLFVLNRTKFGQHTFAIGGSMEAAKRAGIDVRRHLIVVYVLSSFLAGLAGVYSIFQSGVGNFTPFSANYELFAIAAVVIGGASLMGGKGSLLGSVVGVLLLEVMENGLSTSGVPAFYRFIAVGIILIIAVVIDQLFPDLLGR